MFAPPLQDPVWLWEVADGRGAHPAVDGYTGLAELIWTPGATWLTTVEVS